MLSGTRGRSRERGQVIILFALFIPVIFALGAIVIDLGNWYVHKRHLQTQVDAAVLAAATTFGSCFDDQTLNKTVANTAIVTTAARYAGDTLRDPAAVNRQLAEPGDVRVVFNADRYWDSPDGTSNPSTGYGLDFGGNNPAKMPCQTSSLEAKATDEHVRALWGLIPLSPSPKAHAKIEIHRVRAENGLLPIAVPEIDPNFVYAIFVDYRDDGTQQPIAVQKLQANPGYTLPGGSPPPFLYSDWETIPNSTLAANQNVSIHGNNSQSMGTGVVILVSKQDLGNPPNVSLGQTLTTMCTQNPNLVACYAGTGGNFDGSSTGQGLAFIHSYRTSGAPADGSDPRLLDVNLGATLCPGGPSPGNQSSPYFVNDDIDCTVSVTAKVDFGVAPTSPGLDPTVKPSQGGYCAQVGSLSFQPGSMNGTISTWTGTLSVPSAAGPQVLTLNWSDKLAGSNCSNGQSGNFGQATMSYSQDDAAGPVGYLNLTAQRGCGSTVTDAHSVEASTTAGVYCYTVDVGLSKPLQAQPWNYPDLVLRFASKAARKSGRGDANLNGSLLCDHGRTLVQTFTTGCFTTYALNYDKWGTGTTPYGTTTNCTAGALCWEDVLCDKYSPPNPIPLPPMSTVNNPAPDCVAAKGGQVQAFQQAVYNRWEDPANRYGVCPPNDWPTDATTAATFFNSVDATPPGHDFTNDPRYITLIVTDNTAFSDPNRPVPVKYFAGFYVTGWDTDNGAGKPKGCYGNNPPGVNKCGAPNNDAHPLLGCLAGKTVKEDNGDLWGHFVKTVVFSSSATPSTDLCDLTSTSPETCVAVLVE